MSRVHDALRKAEQLAKSSPLESAPIPAVHDNLPPADANTTVAIEPPPAVEEVRTVREAPVENVTVSAPIPLVVPPSAPVRANGTGIAPFSYTRADADTLLDLTGLLERIKEVPFSPAADAHLIDVSHAHEAPTEEFRTLRTRLNHLQSLQPIHSVIVTSPSPAEGKSFAAINLALAESHLAHNNVVLCDFDLRRPVVHHMFQVERSPGLTDYLLGKAKLEDCIKKVADSNLYIIPAGEAVLNPLELLNLPGVKQLIKSLPQIFNWVVMDSPPLLFAADAALLGTMCDGSVLVVRLERTTIDSVTRAINSLCENNVLGIIVNGARRGELYSKYTYYHSHYYTSKPD